MTLNHTSARTAPASPGLAVFRVLPGRAAPCRQGLDAKRALPGFPIFRRYAAAKTAAPPSVWVIPLPPGRSWTAFSPLIATPASRVAAQPAFRRRKRQ
jgi:hypothetical protein